MSSIATDKYIFFLYNTLIRDSYTRNLASLISHPKSPTLIILEDRDCLLIPPHFAREANSYYMTRPKGFLK